MIQRQRPRVNHVDYLVDMIGPEQVGLGLDFCESGLEMVEQMIESGAWTVEDYPPGADPRLVDLQCPSQIQRIREELARRGYPSEAIAGIMGENWIDLFKRAWAAGPR